MKMTAHQIMPCLWMDTQAEEAANFYVAIFENSRVERITRYGQVRHEVLGKPAGSVMSVEFSIAGHRFVALNGGPQFKFSEAVSFQVHCETQQEIDYFWGKLVEGGQEGPCGWLKDKYGLSWQVVPITLTQMLDDPNAEKSQRVSEAFLHMKKFDIEGLKRAYEGRG